MAEATMSTPSLDLPLEPESKPIIASESLLETKLSRFNRATSLPALTSANLSLLDAELDLNKNGNAEVFDQSGVELNGADGPNQRLKEGENFTKGKYQKLLRRVVVSEGDAGAGSRSISPSPPPSPAAENDDQSLGSGGFITVDSYSIRQSDSRQAASAPSPAPSESADPGFAAPPARVTRPKAKIPAFAPPKASTSTLKKAAKATRPPLPVPAATPSTNGRPRRSTAASGVGSNGKSKFIDHGSDTPSDSEGEEEDSEGSDEESEEEVKPKSKSKPRAAKRVSQVDQGSDLSDFGEEGSPAPRTKKTYSKLNVVANSDKLTCPHAGCDKRFSQRNGLKYHLKHGRCNVPGTKSFVEEMKGKPHVCWADGCGKRYKNRNGLRYHYEHSPSHGAHGMLLFAEDRHPRPEGTGESPTGEADSDGNVDSPKKVKPMRKTSTYVRTSRVERASKKVEADAAKKEKAEAKALAASRLPPPLLPFQTFSSEYHAAKSATARAPLELRLKYYLDLLGMKSSQDRVSCDFCYGSGITFDWIELETHLLGNHATGLEAYCTAAPGNDDLQAKANSHSSHAHASTSANGSTLNAIICSSCQITFTGINAVIDLKRHEEIKHMDGLDEEEDAAGSDDDDFSAPSIGMNGDATGTAPILEATPSIEMVGGGNEKRAASADDSPNKRQKV